MTVEVALNSPKIIVWCTMSSNEILGSFFFEELTVNQENYLDMLESFFYPYLQRRKLTKKIIFQQDDAPAHFAKSIRSWLNNKLDNRWIGRGGSISWAPRSPDMTSLDFFLWGYIKNNVYKNNLKDLDDLKIKIIQEIRSIEKETLKNVFSEFEKRLSFCISVEGNTFEQYF